VAVRTVGRYLAAVIALLLVLRSEFVDAHLLMPMRTAVTAAATGALVLLGLPAVHVGTQIFTANLVTVSIVSECTGLEAVILLLPAILVFPADWRAKAVGVLLGLGVMAVVNFLRVVSLCYVATYSATALHMGHLYVWPVVVIVVALVTLLVWVERFAHPSHA
jgi:exosortase/archaeosortase family protein